MNPSDPTQRRLGTGMIVVACLLLLGLLTLFFDQRLERRDNPNRNLVSHTTDAGVREVVLQRHWAGHYLAPGRINGEPVRFLLDTGASDVSIPAALAPRLGLEPGAPLRVRTANGVITVFATVAKQVELGDIVLHNVRASLNPYADSDVVLLGMSFMRDLEIVQQGRTMTLRQY